ncbi:hypothetical protein J1N35_014207, partial [Gossypium stocksii]
DALKAEIERGHHQRRGYRYILPLESRYFQQAPKVKTTYYGIKISTLGIAIPTYPRSTP